MYESVSNYCRINTVIKLSSCFTRLLGFDKLLEYVTTEWLNHLKSQFPNLLGSVGPMTTIVQLSTTNNQDF